MKLSAEIHIRNARPAASGGTYPTHVVKENIRGVMLYKERGGIEVEYII